MQQAEKLKQAIEDGFVNATAGRNKSRRHLGASLLGRKCPRELWYIFRWCQTAAFEPRMLRLFNRGDREEDHFISLLRNAGVHVISHDPEGKQLRCVAAYGHGGGSLDSVLTGVSSLLTDLGLPEFVTAEDVYLGEYKTHNAKSFAALLNKGVRDSKFEHYIQMQLYMKAFNFKAALYFAVNKDTDELYIELVEFLPLIAERYSQRCNDIVFSAEPPPRAANSPSRFVCRFCDYKRTCFTGQEPLRNCRTCEFSEPTKEGNAYWHCNFHKEQITDKEFNACASYVAKACFEEPEE